MVYKIGYYKCKFLIENIIKKLIIILFICNTFVLLSVTNAVSSEQTNVKNINLSKNAKTFDQIRKIRNELYSDIMKTGFTTESEINSLVLIYNTYLGELRERYPDLTLTEMKKEGSNLQKMQNKIKKELEKNNNAMQNARIDLSNAKYRVEDSIIFTPIYKIVLNKKKEVFDNLQRQNDKLKQEEKEVDRKYKYYEENDYKRILLLEKIKALYPVEKKFIQQIRSIEDDSFKVYIIKEKCLSIRSSKDKTECQYDVITELLDMDGRTGYFNNKLSNNELKEKEKFKLKYEVLQEILGGVNLWTFGNSQSSYDPIKNYMNARCNNITDIVDKRICESNFIDKFIEIGEIEFSKDRKLVVHNIEKLDGFMRMSESVEVNNNNDRQYTVSEQNNILVKQGIVKVNDNGAVTYIDKDMLKKFLIEHGVKLSGEYATEETSTKEMINEFKEAEKDNTEIINVNYTKYNNGTSNRCNNAPNGYYTDSGSQCVMSMVSVENTQNQPQEQNKLPDLILTDNFKSYIIKEKCVDIEDTTQRSICEDNAINELTEREGRRGYKIPLIEEEVFSKLTDKEKQEEQEFKTKYEMKNKILSSSLDKANMDKYCEGIEDSTTRELCESNYVDMVLNTGKSIIESTKSSTQNPMTEADTQTVMLDNDIKNQQEKITVKVESAEEEIIISSTINNNNNNEMRELIEEYSNNSNNDNTLLSTTSIENIQNPTQEIVNNIEDTKSSTQNSIEINNNDNNDNNVIITQNPMTEADTQTVMLDNDIKNQQEKITVKVESAEETTEEPATFPSQRTMMRSAAPKRTVVNDLSASQKAQNAMLSSINNNVNRVRYTNNKNLNNSIYNSIKDNVINDSNNAGSINDSMWYSINTDMLSNRDDKTKSTSGSVLANFGYNFDFIDNINSSVTVSFNQTKSDLKTYSKDIPVNAYNFALSLFNKYNFGNDIVLSGMLSYNHNIVKDRNTKNIQYGYVDGDDYITSNFTKQTNKKHYNDISLSVSALYNKVILDNVKLSSGFDINYFTTNKFHNALILSPVMELSSVNGMYNNILFPVVYVKYNTNINNKNININNTNNIVKLDKSNAEYGIKTNINLPNKLNCVLSYSSDLNKNNNFGANVSVRF